MTVKSVAAGVLAACLWLPACGPAPNSGACGTPEAFRDAVVERLRKLHPGATVDAKGPLEVWVTLPGQTDARRMFLDNFFADCGRAPEQRDAMLNHLAATAGRDIEEILNAPLPIRQRRLVSVIRPARMDERSGAAASRLVQRPFAGEMAEVLGEKPPGLLVFVDRETVDQFQLGERALWERSRTNIPTVITGVTVEPLSPGIYMVSAESMDAPSLVLHDGFWRDRVTAETGQPIVFFADREHFIYADSARPGAVAGLRRLVAGDDGNAMSLELYRRTAEGAWTVVP